MKVVLIRMDQNNDFLHGIEKKFHSLEHDLAKEQNQSVNISDKNRSIKSHIRNYLIGKFNLTGRNDFKNTVKKISKQSENDSSKINGWLYSIKKQKSSLKFAKQTSKRNLNTSQSYAQLCPAQKLTGKSQHEIFLIFLIDLFIHN